MRQVVLEQRGIDALLDVAHQQEAPLPDLAEKDDRDVVDACPAVGRCGRDLTADGPQHAHRDLVHRQPIPRREDRSLGGSRGGQRPLPRRVAGTRTDHPGLEHATDAIALQQQGEAGDMVLVRVGQDHGIDPTVPRRDPRVEDDEQPVRVGPTVDEQPATARPLDEDRVTLADVEDRDAGDARGSCGEDPAGHRDRDDERDRRAACRGSARVPGWTWSRLLGWHGPVVDRRGCPAACRPIRDPGTPPPPGQDDESERRGDPCEKVERRGEGHACERQAGRRQHDRVEDPQDHPSRCGEDGSDHRRRAGEDQRAAGQRDHAGSHRGRDQGHDQQIDHGRQDCEPSERDEDDRQGRGLGGQRHAEAFREPARHPPAAALFEPVRERRRPGDQAQRSRATTAGIRRHR